MMQQELNKRPKPENGGGEEYLLFDPEQLLAANPAGQIINPRSIRQMEGRFEPKMFDTPKVVKVTTTEGETYLVVDGLNRLNYAASHKDVTFPGHPSFNLNPVKVLDVTQSYLENPTVVHPDEHSQGQGSLTLREYFRAVLPTTSVHVEIAPQRVAAHLIRGWSSLVGEDIASRFSLIAGLEFLTLPSYSRRSIYFTGQTPEEILIVDSALEETRLLLKENSISVRDVRSDAFMLVVNQSQIIGGENVALREVQGLMYDPAIEQKLIEAYPDSEGERTQMRVNIGRDIARWFRNHAGSQNRVQFVMTVLKDKNLTLADTETILSSNEPEKTRSEIYRRINCAKLFNLYLETFKAKKAPEEVVILADRLLGVLTEDYHPGDVVRVIHVASSAMQKAKAYLQGLVSSKEKLVKSGVDPDFIRQEEVLLRDQLDELTLFNSLPRLSSQAQGLANQVEYIGKSIREQQCTYWVGNYVREIVGQSRPGITQFLIRHLDLLNQPYDQQTVPIQQTLKQLETLDVDLQEELLTGIGSFDQALKRQKQRRIVTTVPRKFGVVDSILVETSHSIVSQQLEEAENLVQPSAVPIEVPSLQPTDLQVTERKRIQTNNQRIEAVLRQTKASIAAIDLQPEEYSPSTKRVWEELIRMGGKVVRRHPDILRVVDDWKKRLEEDQRRMLVLIENEQEQAARDARTGR